MHYFRQLARLIGISVLAFTTSSYTPSIKRRKQQLVRYIEQCNQRPERAALANAFAAALDRWKKDRLRRAVPFLSADKSWKFMEELFLVNEKGDRSLVFLHCDYRNAKQVRFQRIEVYAAELMADGWRFHKHGKPGFLLENFTPENAVQKVLHFLVQDGAVGTLGKVRDRYLSERWFPENRTATYAKGLQDRRPDPGE
ncbi:MAG: hypothetical protein AAGN35_14745 [Bacteroidota bacterium]